MAEAEKIMSVSADDIEKIMGVEVGDIEKIMGVEVPSGNKWQGVKAIAMGRSTSGKNYNQTVSRTISTTGSNTADFGDINPGGIDGSRSGVASSSGTYAIYWTGFEDEGAYSGGTEADQAVVVTISSGADALFGSTGFDGDVMRIDAAGVTNGINAHVLGGYSGSNLDTSYYLTIGTSGSNPPAGGELSAASKAHAGINNATYGYIVGGWGQSQTIDRITINTTGDATDVGDLTVSRGYLKGAEDASRAIIHGGYAYGGIEEIDYFATAAGGDASDFGDILETMRYEHSGVSNGTIAEFWGGTGTDYDTSPEVIQIEYVTIQSTGDALDTNAESRWDAVSEGGWGYGSWGHQTVSGG